MPCRKVGLPELVGEPRQRETRLAAAGRVLDRNAKLCDGFGFAAGGGEHAREQRAPLGVRRHLGELAAQRAFGIGGTAGLHQPPDVVRRRIHAGRVKANERVPTWAPATHGLVRPPTRSGGTVDCGACERFRADPPCPNVVLRPHIVCRAGCGILVRPAWSESEGVPTPLGPERAPFVADFRQLVAFPPSTRGGWHGHADMSQGLLY